MDILNQMMEFLADALMSMPVQLLSAIFIFLFGLHFLSEGLKDATQHKLKAFFAKAIKNRVWGVFFGTIITGITQSSTAVTVMTIGFVNAGLMTLLQAASIIVGANIGTTLTGHMANIRFDAFTPVLMVIGGLCFLFIKKQNTKTIGLVLFGFGLFFLGLANMSNAMRPLRDSPVFVNLILAMEGRVLVGILIGAVMTLVLQSSTASKMIIILLAYQGSIDLHIAMPLIFGMNIGTCFTALLSSIKANANAKRAAMFHLIFSLIGTAAFLPFIDIFTNFIMSITWPGVAAHYQVANAHTIFNIVTAIIVLPFLTPLLNFINLFIKDKEADTENINTLDERLLSNPSIAFNLANQEVLKMYDLAIENLKVATHALLTRDLSQKEAFYEKEACVNQMEFDIANFVAAIPGNVSTKAHNRKVASMIKTVSDIERIGDHSRNIMEAAQRFIDNHLLFSNDALEELKDMYNVTLQANLSAYECFKTRDLTIAEAVITYEKQIDQMEAQLRDNHVDRLQNKVCQLASGIVFLDVISHFERIADHSKSIAVNLTDEHKAPVIAA